MTVGSNSQAAERWANPAMLKWARKRMGLEPKDIEAMSGISSSEVVALEMGEVPTLAVLEELAEIYACPAGYFFLSSPPEEYPILDYRGLSAEKVESLSYETRLHLSEFRGLADYIASLAETTGLTREISIGVANLNEPIYDVAKRERERFEFSPNLREQWASAYEAFDFWRNAVESRGVFVISLKLNPNQVRGASIWDSEHTPVILVNRNDMEAATGRTFTLLHEWAHLLIKQPGSVCDFRGQAKNIRIEHFANAFAAEILVPKQEFESHLRNEGLFQRRPRWGDSLLDKIRNVFWVSRDVVAILLEEMELAPPGFYQSKRAIWDQRRPFFRGGPGAKPGRTKAVRRLDEIGRPLADLVSVSYRQGAISKLHLADLLNMRVEQAERFVSWIEGMERNRKVG